MNFNELIEALKDEGVVFEAGLTDQEFNCIEELYEIKFPPDFRDLLSIALPISNNFVNWRDVSQENQFKIREKLNWPLEGMIFDIENNAFWYDKWGKQPTSLQESTDICRKEYMFLPKMIPICSHRYIPSKPFEEDNPIFSIYQTDIIYYGENLKSYLQIEFHMKKYEDMDFKNIKEIEFWSDL